MRRILLALVLLTACGTAPPQGPSAPDLSPLITDDIAITPLDGPAAAPPPADATPATDPAADLPGPKPRPDTLANPEPGAEQVAPETGAAEPAAPEPLASVPEDPPAPKSADQVLCEKTGGQWAVAGKSGAFSCIKPTRDGGKSCTKKGDCQGMCLARSGTCAPFMPLFGCNEILEKDGRRVTLCID